MFTSLSAEDLGLTLSFAEAVRVAAAAGFDAVDIHMAELLGQSEMPSASMIQDQLAAAGLRSGGWWLPVEFREGKDKFEADLAQLSQAGPLARALGSPWCLTWVWPFSDELDHKSNWELHADRLGRVARELAEYGCRLGFEFIGSRTMRIGHKYDFISTLPESLELIDDIRADNVGLLLDCFQWYASGGNAASLNALAKDQVVYVHLNDAPTDRPIADQVDNQRRLPGSTGVIDINTFLKTLKRVDFEGPIAVEPYDPAISNLPAVDRATAARASVETVFKKAGLSMD